MKNSTWAGLAAALILSTGVQAQDRFIGMGLGQVMIDDSTRIGGTSVAMDDDAMGWKLYGGAMITDNFGFEAGWTDLGDMNSGGVDIETEGLVMAGLVGVPVGDVSLYGKLGIVFWDQDINTVNYDGEDLMYGIGARYRMGQFHVRLEWERFDAKLETDMITIGGGIQF